MRWLMATIAVAGALLAGSAVMCRSRAAAPQPVALSIRSVCRSEGVPFPPKRIFLRAFKQEKELEVWGAGVRGRMHLLKTYPIAAASGGPGPKRKEGDLQVPEGVYRIDRFNPHSLFHLSLGLNYPNKADRMLGDPVKPGADIFIHGNRVSIGCLAMTDPKIEEIYGLASAAKSPISVHIFPCRMSGQDYERLKRASPNLVPFWKQLEPIYRAFESTHVVPKVAITSRASYVLAR